MQTLYISRERRCEPKICTRNISLLTFRHFEVRTVLCTHLNFNLNFNLTVSRIQVMCYHTCARHLEVWITSGLLVRLLSRTRFGFDTLCEFQSGSHECWNSSLFPESPTDRPTDRLTDRPTDAGEESAPLVYHSSHVQKLWIVHRFNNFELTFYCLPWELYLVLMEFFFSMYVCYQSFLCFIIIFPLHLFFNRLIFWYTIVIHTHTYIHIYIYIFKYKNYSYMSSRNLFAIININLLIIYSINFQISPTFFFILLTFVYLSRNIHIGNWNVAIINFQI